MRRTCLFCTCSKTICHPRGELLLKQAECEGHKIMAAFETTRPAHMGTLVGGRVSRFISSVFGAIATWNDNRVTRNALAKLSDRELDDIGLCRGDIDAFGTRNI